MKKIKKNNNNFFLNTFVKQNQSILFLKKRVVFYFKGGNFPCRHGNGVLHV